MVGPRPPGCRRRPWGDLVVPTGWRRWVESFSGMFRSSFPLLRKSEPPVQPHLPVRLPCYDFTPVTSPAFGIPLLAVKHVCRPGHKGHDDLTSSSPSSGLSPAVCSGHAPPVSAFPKAPLSFKRIRGMSSPGGILNALATALHGSIRTTPSIHRLRLGLLGVLSPLVFFPISTHFTAPPEIPSAPTVLQLDALRPIIPDNACILCLTAAAGTELADAYSPDTVIASSPGKEESGPCLSPSVADHPLGPATDHRLGHRKDLEDPPKHESRDLS
ncbi:hypothetical protein RIF29_46973 [Crotalaria pallida]|uniref:Uncharacterized protein n=1 Tax=Crotalaria pallida TaxID=3830 RepID=A0AAN9DR98_CROPI